MRKLIYLFILFTSLSACNKTAKDMDVKELALINSGDKETPFRVLIVDNPEDSLFLRKKAEDVNIKNIANNKDLQLFIERLKLTMAVESGVGIAAPQVGLGRNIFLFMRLDKPGFPVGVAINPKIVNHPDETICFEDDGCLSIPNQSGDTERYAWVDVEYYDQSGEPVKERLSGHSRGGDFTGIVFQHEFDHLHGVLFTDKLCE